MNTNEGLAVDEERKRRRKNMRRSGGNRQRWVRQTGLP